MADRRPPMPRNGGRTSSAAPHNERPTDAAPVSPSPVKAEPVKRARQPREARPTPAPAPKVVPMGAVPETGGSSSRQERPGKAAPAPAKATAKAPAGLPSHPKVQAPKSKAPARPPAAPKVQAPKQRPTASQRRSDDRTMLSGAIRAPHGSEPVDPKPKGKASSEDSKPVPARSFSGRLVVLSLVLAVFAVMLVPTIGIYTRQRAEITDLRASIADKQVEQQELKDQISRWDDPLYIKQQARDRINLVMPGERNYMVIGSSATSPETEPVNESPEQVRTDLPWVDALWDTVQRAATD